MLNRDGLDVLVHPLTEDVAEDHSSYAVWLGDPVELKLHTLPHGAMRTAAADAHK
jgi:DOPA 4,5-dioxygenase